MQEVLVCVMRQILSHVVWLVTLLVRGGVFFYFDVSDIIS